MNVDTAAINSRFNLVDLIGQKVNLKKVAAHEWAGPCIKCGGKDRLHVNDQKGWFCRRCTGDEKWQDAIDFYQWYYNIGFIEAITRMGGKMDLPPAEIERMKAERERAEEAQRQAEQEKRAKVHQQLTDCPDWKLYQQNLDRYPEARRLWHERGLNDDWIAYYGLGYNPGREFSHGDEKFTSASLTIPYFRPVFTQHPEGGASVTWRVVGLQHRLLDDKAPGGKYRPHLAGAGKSLFYADVFTRRLSGDVLIVEGEVKAMVTWASLWIGEECFAPNLDVVGTAGASLKGELLQEFQHATRIFIILDPDAQKEAHRLAGTLGENRCKVIGLPEKIDDLINAGALDFYSLIGTLE